MPNATFSPCLPCLVLLFYNPPLHQSPHNPGQDGSVRGREAWGAGGSPEDEESEQMNQKKLVSWLSVEFSGNAQTVYIIVC